MYSQIALFLFKDFIMRTYFSGMVHACIITLCAGLNAQAAIVTVEPDDYVPRQDLTNVVPGVTLSVADGSGTPQVNDQVVAYQGDFASTGILVFGRQVAPFVPDENWFLQDSFVHSIFRADFQVPVDQVSIDVIRLDAPSAVDEGALLGYDASGALLDTAIVSLGAPGTFSTATISSPTANIAYILAGGYPETSFPPWSVVSLDNLQFNVVPIPPALWLFGSGLVGLIGIARRKKA